MNPQENIGLEHVRLRSKTMMEFWSQLERNIQSEEVFIEVLRSRDFQEMVESKRKLIDRSGTPIGAKNKAD